MTAVNLTDLLLEGDVTKLHEPLTITTDHFTWLLTHSYLQLAARHPGTTGRDVVLMEAFAAKLMGALVESGFVTRSAAVLIATRHLGS